MRQKKLLIAVFLVLLLVIIFGLFAYKGRNQKTQEPATQVSFKDKAAGIQLNYDSGISQVVTLTAQDKSDNVVLSLTDKGPEHEDYLITIRYETGLAAAAAITRQSLINYLENSAGLQLARKPEYKLLELSRESIDGKEVVRYLFTYKPAEGITAQQELLIIPVSTDKAVYASFQSKAEDFPKISTTVFNHVKSSLTFSSTY